MAGKLLESLILVFGTDLAGLNKGMDQASGKIKNWSRDAKKDVSGVKGEFDSLGRSASGLLAGLVSLAAAAKMLGDGLQYNAQIETMRLGLASIVSANETLLDQNGKQIEGAQKLAYAKEQVEGVFAQLKQDAIDTTATLPQLISSFQAAVGPAMAMGLSLDETRRVTVSLVQAMGAMGIPLDQARQEINSILQAQITEDSQLAKNLGLNNEMVKSWSAQGKLVENMLGRLKDFAVAGKEAGNTWEGATSTLNDNFDSILGVITSPAFDEFKQFIIELNNDAFGESAQENARIWGQLIGDGLSTGLEIAKSIGRVLLTAAEGWKRIISFGASIGAKVGGEGVRIEQRNLELDKAGYGYLSAGIRKNASDADLIKSAYALGYSEDQVKHIATIMKTVRLRVERAVNDQVAETADGLIAEIEGVTPKKGNFKAAPRTRTGSTGKSGKSTKAAKNPKGSTARGSIFDGPENAYELAMSSAGVTGSVTKELEAAKKLLNDLEYIRKKGKITSEEQHQLEIKINNAKEKIRTTTEQINEASSKGKKEKKEEAERVAKEEQEKFKRIGSSVVSALSSVAESNFEGLPDHLGQSIQSAAVDGLVEAFGESAQVQSALAMLGKTISSPAGIALSFGAALIGGILNATGRAKKEAKDFQNYLDGIRERHNNNPTSELRQIQKEREGDETLAGLLKEREKAQYFVDLYSDPNYQGGAFKDRAPFFKDQLAAIDKQIEAANATYDAAEESATAAEKLQKAGETLAIKRTLYEEGRISPEEWIAELKKQAAGKMITSGPNGGWNWTTPEGIQWQEDMNAAREALKLEREGGRTLTGDSLARAQNDAGILSDQKLLDILTGTFNREKGEHGESWATTTEEGISLGKEIADLAKRIGEGLKDALGQYSQFNPLPVKDYSIQQLFAAGPQQRFFYERQSTVNLHLRVDGKTDEASIAKMFTKPDMRDLLRTSVGMADAAVNIIPGQ